MICVYVYRYPDRCPYEWAEVKQGWPVHPGELQRRVKDLINAGQPFATLSDIVISMLGWMVRTDQVGLPVRIVYVDADGVERENKMDGRGDLIMPWPEEGFDSIQEAAFHYRYC